MIVCVDVDYRVAEVVTACIGFHDWADAAPAFESVTRTDGAPPEYESGAFYRRELPYIVAALAALTASPRIIVVDGYVWLAPWPRRAPARGARWRYRDRRCRQAQVRRRRHRDPDPARHQSAAAVRQRDPCGRRRRRPVRASHAWRPPDPDAAQARRPAGTRRLNRRD